MHFSLVDIIEQRAHNRRHGLQELSMQSNLLCMLKLTRNNTIIGLILHQYMTGLDKVPRSLANRSTKRSSI